MRHGHVKVNGRRVTIPSYQVRKGDVVELAEKSRSMIVVRHNLDTLDRQAPPWLETGDGGFQVTVRDHDVTQIAHRQARIGQVGQHAAYRGRPLGGPDSPLITPDALVAGESDDRHRGIRTRAVDHLVPTGVLGARPVVPARQRHRRPVDHSRPLASTPFLTTAATSGTPGR